MKRLLLCLVFLASSNVNHSKDFYITYPNYPFSVHNSLSAGFTIDSSGLLTNLKFNKKGLLIGVSARAIVTAFMVSSSFYLVYKAYCNKKQKTDSEQEQ